MKFSVLLPTLGEREIELKKMLKSLEMQTYKDFEVVIISQSNHEKVKEVANMFNNLNIKHVCLNKKGLSYARNEGLKVCQGEVIILSDDDCWYHDKSLEIIKIEIEKNNADFLFTQIYDFDNDKLYKNYSKSPEKIKNKFSLLSKSSIEIAFKKHSMNYIFDENFGVGSEYVCGEEVDFLINNFSESKNFIYVPVITVYHPKKSNIDDRRVFAKGALYAKNFNFFIGIFVLIRDLVIKKQNNLRKFLNGYFNYKRCHK